MEINIDALYNILKQNQGDVNDALGYKNKAVVVTSDPLALVAEKMKVSKRKKKVVISSDSEDCKKAKVKDYNYYKTKMFLAKKDSDEQVLLVEDQAWMESISDSDQEINANMVFMAQIEKKRIVKTNQQSKDLENQNKDLQEKYDVLLNQVNTFEEQNNEFNEQIKVLNEKNADLFAQMEVLQDQLKKKKESSNTSNVDLSSVSLSNLNKNVKRYSRKDLLSCNNSHLGETSSAYVCNNAMNDYCNSRMCDLFDENNLFIFDDESVRISPVSKMPFRKKPRDSINIVQICLWIIDSGCSKHMMGNRALLTNFVKKFLGTVRFGNNDFAVIAGYGDVVIGSMTIKKVYYVKGLGHNLFSVGQFCDKGLEVAFRKSTCFIRNEDGVDLLTAKASSSQSWLWHQRLSHLNFATINNLVKNNLVQGLPKMKFKKDHLCSACEQGKIHHKHHKSKMAFASNKPLYLLHMDLCGLMHEASEVIISFIKKTQVNLQLQVQRIRTDNNALENGVVERRNRTLVEDARTVLTFANLTSFLWAEAIATACFIQNHSIIHKRFDKTPYELMNKRKPNIKFFRVFGCRWYLLNDYEDVGKLKAKGDIGVFVEYSKESAAFRIYNK
nr:hypothetical protein [Tanacetum cinerariifolium]